MAFRVGEMVQLQSVHHLAGRCGAGQHGRHHHHHAVLGRYAVGQRQARQVSGPCRLADQPVDHRHHRFGRRKQHQRRTQQGQPQRRSGGARIGAVAQQHPRDHAERAQQQRAQVDRQGHCGAPGLARELPCALAGRARAAAPAVPHRPASGRPPRRRLRLLQSTCISSSRRLRHRHFAAAAAPRQPLDAVQRLVARGGMLGFEHLGGEHQPHQRAGAGDDLGPVGVADGAQRRDGVAHAQVVGGLVGGLLCLHRGQVGQRVAQPFVVAAVFGRATGLAGAAPSVPGTRGRPRAGGASRATGRSAVRE